MFLDLLNGNRKHRRGSSIACSAVRQPGFECEHAPRLCLQIWRPLRSSLHTSASLLLSPQTCRSSPPTGQHKLPTAQPMQGHLTFAFLFPLFLNRTLLCSPALTHIILLPLPPTDWFYRCGTLHTGPALAYSVSGVSYKPIVSCMCRPEKAGGCADC